MSKILILGTTGGGKSTSIGRIPKLNIEGLNPKETFIIACSSKGLPFAGWMKQYPKAMISIVNKVTIDITPEGNYYVATSKKNVRINDVGTTVSEIISLINEKRPDIKNIILDDTNYIMQDYYMANASKGGYDVFKKIGLFMGKIFNAIEEVDTDKNVIVMAHYEEYKAKNSDRINFRFKTIGNMVQSYITPEGKFEIVLYVDQDYNEDTKQVTKQFITNFDGEFPAKSPVGMFDELHIPNDLGYVLRKVHEYNTGNVSQDIIPV